MDWGLRAVAVIGAAIAGTALAAPDKVFVADEEGNTVSVLDAASFNRITAVPVGREPHNVQISPDGKLAWVTNNGEQAMPGMGKGGHAAMSSGGEVWAIDTASHAVVAKIPVGKHPAHVVLTPDGRFAYVTNGGENTVSVVDTEARRVAATIPVGKGPAQTGFAPDGRLAFVSLSQENKVALIDPAARKVLKKVAVGTVPIQVYPTPDGRTLLVANQGTKQKPGNTVSVIDLADSKVVNTVRTGPGAHGVVVDREGRYAYVSNIYENSVSVLDVKSAKVVASVRVGAGPNGISVTP